MSINDPTPVRPGHKRRTWALPFVLALVLLGVFLFAALQRNSGERRRLDAALPPALARADVEEIKQLLRRGASHRLRSSVGRGVLSVAAEKGDVELILQTTRLGHDVNAADPRGWAPLHYAAAAGHREAVELLLSRGASATLRTPDGKSAGDLARAAGKQDVAALLGRP